jgi:hypothetical protein
MNPNRRLSQATPNTRPSDAAERRSVCRYSVVLDSSWLGWWVGEAFQSTPAKIIDISLRGALLNVDTFPPKDKPGWFCAPGVTNQEEWIEVKLVGSRKRLFGPREVRVAFRKLFPYEIFKTVVYGPDAFPNLDAPAWLPENAAERDWW